MKYPAFQFYPADWRKDPALQGCSLAARGLWIQMLCIMHENTPYGYLVVNGKPMTIAQLARNVGGREKMVEKLFNELKKAGVFSCDAQGCVFSRRMVRDEHIRNKRAEGGKLGGNPLLLKQKTSHEEEQETDLSSDQHTDHPDNVSVKQKANKKANSKDNHKVDQAHNLNLTPSSSSTSSSAFSSSPSISSSSGGLSSSSEIALVKKNHNPEKIIVFEANEDDDCPLKPEEWIDYFAKREGKRPKNHSFFSAWCEAKISIKQVEQAIHAAEEKASEPVACLPAYVNQVLTSQARKRKYQPVSVTNKQDALEAHNAHIARQWLATVEVKNASAG